MQTSDNAGDDKIMSNCDQHVSFMIGIKVQTGEILPIPKSGRPPGAFFYLVHSLLALSSLKCMKIKWEKQFRFDDKATWRLS